MFVLAKQQSPIRKQVVSRQLDIVVEVFGYLCDRQTTTDIVGI